MAWTEQDHQIASLDDAVNMGDESRIIALLQQGVDVNCITFSGWTPLITAAFTGQPEIVELLLHHGADASIVDSSGQNAFDLAEEVGHKNVMAVLKRNEQK